MLYLRVLFIIFFVSACSTTPHVVENRAVFSNSGLNQVFVVSHGWHTGIVLPSKNVLQNIPRLTDRFKNTSYIEFGWGDKGFYQSKEITSGLTLRAIFLPTESVVHAVGIFGDVKAYFPNSEIESIYLTDSELASLTQFVYGSFARQKDGNLIPTKKGIYGDSQFYRGLGNYYLFNTCNKWTAKGLKSTGMDISPLLKLTSDSVMDYIKALNSPNKPLKRD